MRLVDNFTNEVPLGVIRLKDSKVDLIGSQPLKMAGYILLGIFNFPLVKDIL